MVEALEHAVAQARRLAPDRQDELASLMMLYLGEDDRPLADLTPEQEVAVHRSREAARRGEIASDEEMQAIWAKYDA